MNRIKLLALVLAGAAFVSVSLTSRNRPVSAGDYAFEEIAAYRTWTKVTKDPIKVEGPFSSQRTEHGQFGLKQGRIGNFTLDAGNLGG